jgi:hypothetical protein
MYYRPCSIVKFCYSGLKTLDFEVNPCHTTYMKNEILSAPPLPVGPALALPALAPEAYTGLEWLTDEAWADCWEIARHDRALFAKH